MNAISKRPSSYVLGSIWNRRDGKQAVIISDERFGGVVQVIAVNQPGAQPYVVVAASGRAWRNGIDTPMDLIYRDEDEIVCKCGEVVDVP